MYQNRKDHKVFFEMDGVEKRQRNLPAAGGAETESIMFAIADISFGPTEISYLENRFCTMQWKHIAVRNKHIYCS